MEKKPKYHTYFSIEFGKIYYTLNNALSFFKKICTKVLANYFEEVILTTQATLKSFCLIFLNYEAQKINRYIFYLKERQTFS